MGWVVIIGITFMMFSYGTKIKKLEAKIKKLNRKNKGEVSMSNIINSLIGKTCKVSTDDFEFLRDNPDGKCEVLDSDEEWIKLSYQHKKEGTKISILRIESISSIELI